MPYLGLHAAQVVACWEHFDLDCGVNCWWFGFTGLHDICRYSEGQWPQAKCTFLWRLLYSIKFNFTLCSILSLWASYQIRKIAGVHAPGKPGKFSPPPRVSDPGMHHGMCVTHVPWCMPGSLTNDFLWSRRRGKRSRHSRRMRKPRFYVSGKRPIVSQHAVFVF